MPTAAEAHAAPERPPRATRSTIFVVGLTILIDFIGFGVLIPVLPEFADQLGASALQISLLLAAYALAQLAFLPAWGWCSDRIGRRPVILISLAGTVASFLILATSETLFAIFASRILGGFFAASVGTAQAVITDVTPPEERASGMGKIGAAAGIALVIGPAMGGLLDDLGPNVPFYAVSAIAAANLVLAFWVLPETKPPNKSAPNLRDLARTLIPIPIRMITTVRDRRTGLYLYFWFHFYLAFAAIEASLPLYLLRRYDASPFDIGLLFAALGIVIAVSQGWLVGRVATRRSEMWLVSVALAGMSIGLAAIPLLDDFNSLYPLGMLIAVGNGIAFPLFTSLYSRTCASDDAGELMGDGNAMAVLGRVLGAVGAGALMDTVSLAAPFFAAGAVMAIGAVLFACLIPVLRPENEGD